MTNTKLRNTILTTTPLSPLSDPLNGDLKLLTSKANS